MKGSERKDPRVRNPGMKRKVLLAAVSVACILGGTGVTLAVQKGLSGQVNNHFAAKDVTIDMTIPETFPEETTPAETTQEYEKKVTVSNPNGTAPVYVRARVLVSPESVLGAENGVTIRYGDSGKWKKGADGFWYYKEILGGGAQTELLLSSVTTGTKTADFDVTVYGETVIAPGKTAGEACTIAEIQEAFAAAETQ